MKALLTLLVCTIGASSLLAQKNKDIIPEFGKVDKSELLLKECDFDKNAEAMILFAAGESVYAINSTTIDDFEEKNFHYRIKIFSEKGFGQAEVHIKYRLINNIRPINHLVAQTYNLDANGNIVVTKLEKAQIFDRKINKKYSEIVFSFPQVKAGSVIEYKYAYEGASLGDWYFQRDIPVKYSRFKLDFPQEIYVQAVTHCVLPVEVQSDPKAAGVKKTYIMQNVPGLRDEPYISSNNDYRQRLETVLVSLNFPGIPSRNMIHTWPWVIRALMEEEDFGVQLKRNIPRTSDLEQMLEKLKSPYDKMVTIHHYVRKNMAWNGQDNIWASDGVKSAWKDKKGTSGEINLILVNLLKDAGLNAHPILVSTRANGKINSAVPGVDMFDKVLAYVTIDDNRYILDATEKHTPSQLIPLDVSATEGLVIEKLDTYEWGWQTLWNPDQQFKTTVMVTAEIDKDGLMKGDATVSSADYARVVRMPKLKEGKDKFKEAYFTSLNPGSKVDSLEIENEDIDSLPLVQKIKFTEPTSASGEYKYFSANLFTGLEKNPFVADARFSDIFFGANQRYNIVGSFNIPEGYTFDELPKNVRMIMPDTSISFTRLLGTNENTLSVRYNLEFKRPVYSNEDYPEFKEFCKKLFGLLSEQFVIKKKANP